MEALSTCRHRGRVPWQGLLLAVSLSIFWVPQANGEFLIESRQHQATKAPYVILNLDKLPKQANRYIWYKGDPRNVNNQIASYIVKTGKTIPGSAYKGQQILYPGATLKIRNVTKEDTGYYTVEAIMTNNVKINVSTHLFVLEPMRLAYARECESIVHENDDVGILCLTHEPDARIHWLYNGRKLLQGSNKVLSVDHAMLSIDLIKKEDAGHYQCKYMKLPHSGRSDTLKLEVV